MGDFYHTLMIVGLEGNEIFVAAHTNDALDRPLSSYDYAARRFISIEGFRVEYPDDACFEDLINGIAL